MKKTGCFSKGWTNDSNMTYKGIDDLLILSFNRSLQEMSDKKKDENFYDSTEMQIIISVGHIFRTAERYVWMFTSPDSPEMKFGRYQSFIEGFLSGDCNRRFDVIFENCTNSESIPDALKKLIVKYKNQVSVKLFLGSLLFKENDVHFLVSDDRMTMLVTDVDKNLAFGNFNSEKLSSTMKTCFENLKNHEMTYCYYESDET